MKSSPAEQKELLRLQRLDTRLQQLAHRLSALPQTTALAELDARDDAERRRRAEASGVLEDARIELGRVESDVATVEARIARDSDRLTHTSSVKDVNALESELTSLRKRLSDLEDIEIAVMQRVEDAEGVVAGIDAVRETISADVIRVSTERDAASGELATERDQVTRDREAVASTISDELQAFYERRRAAGGGVGAALLQARTCGGCTITLTGSDLEAVRRAAPDDVIQCPDCERILVRTDESGI
ncbi:zinc ribbon domain-containing protein [Agromyces atrinae]|uniref:Uncharacterized protein n=1 Tax=Agromyces atrinae TaxID=592376 RepID=A0A4Q2M575_9MICO|nr:C4-type zinc ribbon domain-containing protein [Agromyces atrinae]NYD66071.1 hypothetical protein [Agromyces atrinae]RXZ86397.1 hypothetical protein ESP50_11630 [Agromyces atrinae]